MALPSSAQLILAVATLVLFVEGSPTTCDDYPAAIFCEDWRSGSIGLDEWKHEVAATGGGNGEFQMYTQHEQNSFVSNGSLHLRPSFTYHTHGDLRGALDLRANGCTCDWRSGCLKEGALSDSVYNPGGKLYTSSITKPTQMPALRDAIAAAGLPACNEVNGVCDTMIPIGGLRQHPVMSAKLVSRKGFRYGRIEINATLPRGDYLWPALWMLPAGDVEWPLGGEIDIMESMGNDASSGFALDPHSTSSALHLGSDYRSWYDLAFSPTLEALRGVPTGSAGERRSLSDGPHTFGLYWAKDNLYMYVDDDARRTLDMDEVFRRTARRVLEETSEVAVEEPRVPRHEWDGSVVCDGATADARVQWLLENRADAFATVDAAREQVKREFPHRFESTPGDVLLATGPNGATSLADGGPGANRALRRKLAMEVAERGYLAGWRKFCLMSGRSVPAGLWDDEGDAPFDRPFHLILNLAVGGGFFGGGDDLNPNDAATMWDVPLALAGQLPPMYWYSRMKTWWPTWAKKSEGEGEGEANERFETLPPAFESASTGVTSFLDTRPPSRMWAEFGGGGQDAGAPASHKADLLAGVPPPANEAIGDHVDFQIHSVVVLPVEGSQVVQPSTPASCPVEQRTAHF